MHKYSMVTTRWTAACVEKDLELVDHKPNMVQKYNVTRGRGAYAILSCISKSIILRSRDVEVPFYFVWPH